MTTRSSALLLFLIMGACAPAPTPAAVDVVPPPQEYTCEQTRQASAEYRALPDGSVLRAMIDDYGIDRKQRRALLGLPDPAPCTGGQT